MGELLEASTLIHLEKHHPYYKRKRERRTAVFIGIIGTIGWALLLVLIGQG